MHPQGRSIRRFHPSASFVLLMILLATVWVAGGASRPDVAGQMVVRVAAMLLLAGAALLAQPPKIGRVWPAAALLVLAIAIPVLQLMLLPPELWTALPGRTLFMEAALASGQAQPWRPLTIVPEATRNALASLIVPLAVLVLAAGLDEEERARLPTLMIVFIVLAMLTGLLQVSGGGFDNPLINGTPGQVNGIFANRNHFALLLAFGCLIAPVWAFTDQQQARWRAPAALGCLVLLVLTILATGSRAGLVLAALALAIGMTIAWRDFRRLLRHYPAWVRFALFAGVGVLLLIAVIFSVQADRAVSIDRLFAVDTTTDIRSRSRPTVLAMIAAYFPTGSGVGGFDSVFRIHEPFDLLKLTYLNHAHNDFLEVALDAGILGIAAIVLALVWWAWASVKAWRAAPDGETSNARVGSAILLLILVASLFDYPVRTPTIMVFAMLAAMWLCAPGAMRRHG